MKLINFLAGGPRILMDETTPTAIAQIQGLFTQVYNWIIDLVGPLAIVGFVASVIGLFISKNEQNVEKAKHGMIVTLIAIALCYLAPAIVNTVIGLFTTTA